MQTTKPLILILALTTLGLTGLAQAHGYHASEYRPHHDTYSERNARFNLVDIRQQNQQRRIREGIRSGELTRHEVRALHRQQDKIARMERRFERDGYLNKREHKRLLKALDRASRSIAAAKHDNERRDRRHDRYDGYDHKPERIGFVRGRAHH